MFSDQPVGSPVHICPMRVIEIKLFDHRGYPVPEAKFVLSFPPTPEAPPEMIVGFLDKDGYAKLTNIRPGIWDLRFPEYDFDQWRGVDSEPEPEDSPEQDPEDDLEEPEPWRAA